jgi:hypothetical protein
MNAQAYNYKNAVTEVSNTLTNTQNFQNDSSMQTQAIADVQSESSDDNNLIIKDLSASLLKSVHEKTQRKIGVSLTYSEAQALNFETSATIKTADKELSLNLQVSLSRSFVQQTNLTVEDLMRLQDPLVVQLEGAMPTLSSKTFAFDLDSDGTKDQISLLGKNSAFLALDKNANGKIDDGSELFGAQSGDGFGDLAKYDDDKNGWIDENDAIFNKLRIWKKNEGKDQLIAIGEVGIGAIFLGNVYTPFDLKTSSNSQLGQIRNSGFFVFENGKAGVVSQLDLAMRQENQDGIEQLNIAKGNVKKLQALNSYKNESNEDDNSLDKQLEKLQALLDTLETKLANAKEEEKPSIQAQIGALFTRMMTMVTREFKSL